MAAHTPSRRSIAVVGAGMGGLTATSALRLFGYDAQVNQQTTWFARFGSGIQVMPNSMKVLRRIGVEARIRATDTSWLCGHDAWSVPLTEPALNPAS